MREKIREIIEDLSSKAPLDFIGTGNYAIGEMEAKEWGKHKKKAINELYNLHMERVQEAAKIAQNRLIQDSLLHTSQGVAAIFKERLRQIKEEGWTPEHDDYHTKGQLAKAAATYAYPEEEWTAVVGITLSRILLWPPWAFSGFKPSQKNTDGKPSLVGRQREIEKAGALLAAEWERLERLKNGE